jgi:hypothetical protein
MADVNINLFKKIEENTTETDGFPEGYLIASVNGKVQGINPYDIGGGGGGGKEWQLQFFNQANIIQVEATPDNIATFESGFGVNIGAIEVSTDGVTYIPLVFPFSPSVGTLYFKRSLSLVTGVYTISE